METYFVECLPYKRGAIKTQMICLTSFFCSCEYTGDIFPRLFRQPPPAVCQKQATWREKKILKKCIRSRCRRAVWEWMSSERKSSKQDRDHPAAVMVTDPDQRHQHQPVHHSGKWRRSLLEILDLSISERRKEYKYAQSFWQLILPHCSCSETLYLHIKLSQRLTDMYVCVKQMKRCEQ